MKKLKEFYNNDIPNNKIQEIITLQATIIQRIKGGEGINEEQYIQAFIKEHPRLTITEMDLCQEVIEEAFHYGNFYYSTKDKHDAL
jgi:hypothetical protein